MALFGKTPQSDAFAQPWLDRIDAAANVPMMAQQAMQAPKKRGLFGNAFRADSPLWHVLGGAGDVLTGDPVYTQGVQHKGMLRQKGLMEQAQAEAENAQWYEREKWKRDNPMPSDAQPYRFEDNAGNVWERQPDGTNKRIFTDIAPRQTFINGQMVTSPNPYLGQEGMTELPQGYVKRPKGGPASAPGGFPR